jgi:hypothetical protein
MRAALRAKLLAHAPLAALVSVVAWDERPQQQKLPALVLTLVSPGRDYDHEGHDGLDEMRVQIDVWGAEPMAVAAIAAAIPAAIEPEAVHAGWVIGPAFLEADAGDRDELGGKPVFRRRQDWMIFARVAS